MNENDETTTTAIAQAFEGRVQSGTISGGNPPTGVVVSPGPSQRWTSAGRTAIREGVPATIKTVVAATSLAPKLSLPVRVGLFVFGVASDPKVISDVVVNAILDTNSDDPPEAETGNKKKKKTE